MKTIVGILGVSGFVGTAACKYLTRFFKVRGGQRKQPSQDLMDLEDFEYVKVDVFDEESLSQFCKECDVVLNCAGPAYIIKEKVALAAQKNGAVYIDVSDILLVEKSIKETLPVDGTYVLATGYVPGLSGMLPKLIADEYLDEVEKLYCYQGGRQYFSNIAFKDIILNALGNAGYTGFYYDKGDLKREEIDVEEKVQLPGFKEPVYIKSYLCKEMIDIAEKLKIREVHWFNALPDLRVMEAMKKAYMLIAQKGTKNLLEEMNGTQNDVDIYRENITENWSTILYEFYGRKNKKNKRYRCIIRLKDSNDVCGEIAALTTKEVIEHPRKPGMYWAKDILATTELDKYLEESNILDFTLIEIPYDLSNII